VVKIALVHSTGFAAGEILQLTFRNIANGIPSAATYPVTFLEATTGTGTPISGAQASIAVTNQ
jgi:hypothetical protein